MVYFVKIQRITTCSAVVKVEAETPYLATLKAGDQDIDFSGSYQDVEDRAVRVQQEVTQLIDVTEQAEQARTVERTAKS